MAATAEVWGSRLVPWPPKRMMRRSMQVIAWLQRAGGLGPAVFSSVQDELHTRTCSEVSRTRSTRTASSSGTGHLLLWLSGADCASMHRSTWPYALSALGSSLQCTKAQLVPSTAHGAHVDRSNTQASSRRCSLAFMPPKSSRQAPCTAVMADQQRAWGCGAPAGGWMSVHSQLSCKRSTQHCCKQIHDVTPGA